MLALNNVALPVHPSINIWIVLKGDPLDVRFICLLFQVQLLDHALLAEKFVHSRCFGEVYSCVFTCSFFFFEIY